MPDETRTLLETKTLTAGALRAALADVPDETPVRVPNAACWCTETEAVDVTLARGLVRLNGWEPRKDCLDCCGGV